MKWKGMVSHPSQMRIAARSPRAKTPHATSSRSGRDEPIPRMSHSLDGRCVAELPAQPPDAHVDDVRSRIEVIAPDLGKQTLAADDFARVLDQVVEETELAIGELCGVCADACLSARQVEDERPNAQRVVVLVVRRVSQRDAHARNELVERERLAEVVARTQPEPPQLRR